MMDTRPYHEHGPLLGPCSDTRHKLIMDGVQGLLPSDRVGSTSTMNRAQVTLYWSRKESDGLHCACCKTKLCDETEMARIESDSVERPAPPPPPPVKIIKTGNDSADVYVGEYLIGKALSQINLQVRGWSFGIVGGSTVEHLYPSDKGLAAHVLGALNEAFI